MAIGFPIAWLAARTTLPGRRFVLPAHVAGAAAAVLAARPGLGADRSAGRRDVPDRAGLAVGHPPDHGAVRRGAAARPALCPVQLPGHHRRHGGPRAGVRGRRPGARRKPGPGHAADHPDPGPGHLVRAGHRLRRVDQRLRRGRHAGLQLELPSRHLPAVRGDRELPAQLPAGRGHGLAPRRGGGDPAGAAGQGAARPVVRDPVRPDPAGRPPPAQPARRRSRLRRSWRCSSWWPSACRASVR